MGEDEEEEAAEASGACPSRVYSKSDWIKTEPRVSY